MTTDITISDNDLARVPTYSSELSNRYLRTWLVLRPITHADEALGSGPLRAAFDRDYLESAGGEAGADPSPGDRLWVDGREYVWERLASEEKRINLLMQGRHCDYAVAYAFARIGVETDSDWTVAIGSDDGCKVLVNGEVVHEVFAARTLVDDQDLFPVRLKAGVNRLLIKVQNLMVEWEFSCRLIDVAGISSAMGSAVVQGDLDRVEQLLAGGAHVDAITDYGAPALQLAELFGHSDVAKRLIAAGADIRMKSNLAAIADAILTRAYPKDKPGAAVLVAKNGKVLFTGGYGLANMSDGIPVTPETKFRIGSITKQFVASAVMKLEEEGRLSIEDTLSKFIPNYPHGDTITLHHLLNHTSGLQNYTDKPDLWKYWALELTTDEMLKALRDDPLIFTPGTRWAYNNTGYYLLGLIVGIVTGQPWGAFLKERFFDPIGMHNTGVYTPTEIHKAEAIGYDEQAGAIAKAGNLDPSQAGGAGAMYSTVGDLFLWNEAVFNGRVLSPQSIALAHTPSLLINGHVAGGAGYGFGWNVVNYRGLTRISHNGGIPGFLSHLARYPEVNGTITLAQNSYIGTGMAVVVPQLTQVFFGDSMESYAPVKPSDEPDRALWPTFVGRYHAGEQRILHITLDTTGDGQPVLQGRFSGHPVATPLTALSSTEFAWPKRHNRIRFHEDGSEAIVIEDGFRRNVYRIKDAERGTVACSALLAVVGEYGPARGKPVKVTAHDDYLTIILPGAPPLDLYPTPSGSFSAIEANFVMNALPGDDGRVDVLAIDNGGHGHRFRRILG